MLDLASTVTRLQNPSTCLDAAQTPPWKDSALRKRLEMMFSLGLFPWGRTYTYSSTIPSPTSNTLYPEIAASKELSRGEARTVNEDNPTSVGLNNLLFSESPFILFA